MLKCHEVIAKVLTTEENSLCFLSILLLISYFLPVDLLPSLPVTCYLLPVTSYLLIATSTDGNIHAHAGAKRRFGIILAIDKNFNPVRAAVTFTKLPVELSGGKSENFAPVAGEIDCTVPWNVESG